MARMFLHNVADALGYIAVIVAGTLIILNDWRLIDPLITLVIAGYILWQSVTEIGGSVRILMLGSPPDLDTHAILGEMRTVPGPEDVHHLHLCRSWNTNKRWMRMSLSKKAFGRGQIA